MRVFLAIAVCVAAILFAAWERREDCLRLRLAGMPSVVLAAWLAALRVVWGLPLAWHEVLAPLYALALVTAGVVGFSCALAGPPRVRWGRH